jgi:hypothetical protein
MYSLRHLPVDFLIKLREKFYSRTSSSTLSLTSTVDGDEWWTPRSGCFFPGKENPCPLQRKLSRLKGRSVRVRKNLAPLGLDPRTVQPVASSYTDYAIPFHIYLLRDLCKFENVSIVSRGKTESDVKREFLPLWSSRPKYFFRGTNMNLVCGCTWSPVLEKCMYFGYGIMEGGGHGRCGIWEKKTSLQEFSG